MTRVVAGPAPLKGFDFGVVDDPAFKEDSVREEIVTPILWALGYAAHGPALIRRSPALEHPYVAIGSITRRINIIPDYLLAIDRYVTCALDAKAPWENVHDPDHLSQAYTYAVHRDVRSEHYALCNGREFVFFRTAAMSAAPHFQFAIRDIATRWLEIHERLNPHALATRPGEFDKDFGLHLERLGIRPEMRLLFPSVPLFRLGRVNKDVYTLVCSTPSEGSRYAASFDFGEPQLRQLLAGLPSEVSREWARALRQWPVMLSIGTNGPPFMVNVEAYLSAHLEENDKEIYRPLKVTSFIA